MQTKSLFFKAFMFLFCFQTVASLRNYQIQTRNLEETIDSEQVQNIPESDDILNKVIQSLSFCVVILNIFLRPTDISPMIAVSLAKIPQFIRYTNLSLPNSVIERLDLIPFPVLFLPPINFPDSLKYNFSDPSLMRQSYLVNQWKFLIAFLALFAIGAIIYIAGSILEKSLNFRLKIPAGWSLFFVIFFCNYDSMTFFAILEFQNCTFESLGSTLSFISCMIVSLIALYMLIRTLIFFIALKKKARGRKSSILDDQTLNVKNYWSPYNSLFIDYKNSSYFLLFIARMILFSIITAFFAKYPIIQMLWFMIMSAVMIQNTFFSRSLKNKFTLIITIIFETAILLVNSCCTSLVFCNTFSISECQAREEIGFAILVIKVVTDVLSHVFIYTHFGLNIKLVSQTAKSMNSNGKLTRKNLLKALIQSLSSKNFIIEDVKNTPPPRITVEVYTPMKNISSVETETALVGTLLQKEISKASTNSETERGDNTSQILLSNPSQRNDRDVNFYAISDHLTPPKVSKFGQGMFFGRKSVKPSALAPETEVHIPTIIEEPSQLEEKVSEMDQKHALAKSSQANNSKERNNNTIHQIFAKKDKGHYEADNTKIQVKRALKNTREKSAEEHLIIPSPSRDRLLDNQTESLVQKEYIHERKMNIRQRLSDRKLVINQNS